MLDSFREMEVREHTHVNICSLCVSSNGRILVSTPASGLLVSSTTAAVLRPLLVMVVKGIYDHAPKNWKIGPRPPSRSLPVRLLG